MYVVLARVAGLSQRLFASRYIVLPCGEWLLVLSQTPLRSIPAYVYLLVTFSIPFQVIRLSYAYTHSFLGKSNNKKK